MMLRKEEPLPDSELDEFYYHLAKAQQVDHQSARDDLRQPAPHLQPYHVVEFHPDDLAHLVAWEKQTHRSIAIWLNLMAFIALVLIPYTPFFTPLVTLFLAMMSLLFFARSRLITEAQITHELLAHLKRPTFQWMAGGIALALSILTYLFALMVPYSAVPASVQTLLFVVTMNFALYTPISIIRVIRQRALRRKRRLIE